jgi:hypothetical protein
MKILCVRTNDPGHVTTRPLYIADMSRETSAVLVYQYNGFGFSIALVAPETLRPVGGGQSLKTLLPERE